MAFCHETYFMVKSISSNEIEFTFETIEVITKLADFAEKELSDIRVKYFL
jgi:hypothetical protein